MFQLKQRGVICSILFATAAISGSLVFLATQISGGGSLSSEDLQTKIAEGIDTYVENQQAEYEKQQAEANKPKKIEGDFTDDDAYLGDDDAPVVIVEFSDYECPFCAKFKNDTFSQLKEEYIDTGKVKFVYRDLPLSFHPDAYPAALLAECARDQGDDGTYFAMNEKIFETMSGGYDQDALVAYAGELGLDTAELKDCIENDKFKDEIEADAADANRAGIGGTPAFIINGNVISGAQPFASFQSIIEEELAK